MTRFLNWIPDKHDKIDKMQNKLLLAQKDKLWTKFKIFRIYYSRFSSYYSRFTIQITETTIQIAWQITVQLPELLFNCLVTRSLFTNYASQAIIQNTIQLAKNTIHMLVHDITVHEIIWFYSFKFYINYLSSL